MATTGHSEGTGFPNFCCLHRRNHILPPARSVLWTEGSEQNLHTQAIRKEGEASDAPGDRGQPEVWRPLEAQQTHTQQNRRKDAALPLKLRLYPPGKSLFQVTITDLCWVTRQTGKGATS